MSRLPGEGTIEGPRNGMWRFRCPNGRGGRITSPWMFTSDTAAEAELIKLRDRLARGEVVTTGPLTLGEYWERHYLPDAESIRGLSDSTLGTYKRKWTRWTWSGLTAKPLAGLARRDVRLAAKAIAREVDRPDTFLSLLHTVLEQAVKDELIESNPSDSIDLDMAERDSDELRPTPEEITALLACKDVSVPDWHAMAFAVGAGLRPGEWRSLEIADVSLDNPVPHVLVQYGGDERAPTKTRKKRRVPLLGIALRALRAWLPLIATHHPHNPFGLVFPSRSGIYRRQDSPFGHHGARGHGQRTRFSWYLERSGINRQLTPHSLRHGFATEALTEGAIIGRKLEVWQVQIMLGHGRITTTLRYVHPGERDLFHALAVPAQSQRNANEAEKTGKTSELEIEYRRRDSNPRETAPAALDGHLRTGAADSGTSLGLLRALIVRASISATENRFGREDAVALREEVLRIHRENDPVELAVARLGTDHWRSALAELVELLAVEQAAGGAELGVSRGRDR